MKKKKVFIVHGHDEVALRRVIEIIKNLRYKPILLRDRTYDCNTIIEKIESESKFDLVVVLMTPDDKGKPKKEQRYEFRPRQNVIFELGYFFKKLGRKNIIIVRNRKVSEWSDIKGVRDIRFKRSIKEVKKQIKQSIFKIATKRKTRYYRPRGGRASLGARRGQVFLLKRGFAERHFNKGKDFQGRGDFSSAKVEYEEAIRMYPEHIDARTQLGIVKAGLSDLDGSIIEFKWVADKNPNSPGAHFNLGLSFKYKGKYPEAIAEFQEALRLNENYLQAYMELGETYYLNGDLKNARTILNNAMTHCPEGEKREKIRRLAKEIDVVLSESHTDPFSGTKKGLSIPDS